jgi:hypothetical protein
MFALVSLSFRRRACSLLNVTVPRLMISHGYTRHALLLLSRPSPVVVVVSRRVSQKAVESANPAPPTAPLCDCLKPAVQRTVVKRGPTHGRVFWGCGDFNAAQPDKKGCSFFKWVGDAPLKPSSVASSAAGPECKCGEPSVMLTVSRPGPYSGRTFYRCRNGLVNLGTESKESCDFFKWIDPAVSAAAAPDAPSSPSSSFGSDPSDPVTPVCGCNKPAVMLRVTKASPNVGRRFLKCADTKCGFFAWVDV